MKLSFKLTAADINSYHKFYVNKHGSFLQKYLHWLMLLIFVGFLVYNFQRNDAELMSYVLIVPIVFLMVSLQMMFTKYLRNKSIDKYIKNNPAVVGDRVFQFTDKELIVTVSGKDVNYAYDKLLLIEENKTHYFAYITTQNAVIIPKRIFASKEEAESTLEKLKQSIK